MQTRFMHRHVGCPTVTKGRSRLTSQARTSHSVESDRFPDVQFIANCNSLRAKCWHHVGYAVHHRTVGRRDAATRTAVMAQQAKSGNLVTLQKPAVTRAHEVATVRSILDADGCVVTPLHSAIILSGASFAVRGSPQQGRCGRRVLSGNLALAETDSNQRNPPVNLRRFRVSSAPFGHSARTDRGQRR
jgi:hypothetical protein